MVLSYALCMVLNTNQVKEAALLPWQDATDPSGTVIKRIPQEWGAGIGHFVKVTAPPQTQVAYRTGEVGSDKTTDKIVGVRTTVSCSPFLPIPIPMLQVPGLNQPMLFQITSEKTMENPDYGDYAK